MDTVAVYQDYHVSGFNWAYHQPLLRTEVQILITKALGTISAYEINTMSHIRLLGRFDILKLADLLFILLFDLPFLLPCCG